ncbi:phenylalanine--tRNA ligase subunit beta [Candidatus Saccharibacteria bacterium]|nr:phenylalanine--tRNA ligase subunit beta [Candidatus Saccharibacteria bacterium]
MKISLNWLKKYVEVPVSDDELIRLIGSRLVEVEGVIDETHKYDNIYIVRVERAERIPDTHLTLCQINVGDRLVQVVCGAPNVREGMLAVWIAPGAVVPASVHEDVPFVIGKRKMQGYESCGMLAGADELDFGDDHSGIVEIDPDVAAPGDLLADVFELSDLVLEIENKSLTHRPDCFGIIGFAREVAGILGARFNEPNFSSSGLGLSKMSYAGTRAEPSLRDEPVRSGRNIHFQKSKSYYDSENLGSLNIDIKDPSICQRYTAIILEKHGEMKKKYLTWMDTVLSKSGMRPVDRIVDATNYLMLLTGQPLHAFDYDKFVTVGGGDEVEIKVRLARAGEKLTLLDDKEIELNENDIVICSGEVPVALAGAMGGKSTEVDKNTRNIILESATFSLYNLRKTQMAHGIFSEAITRFTKGQPPYQTLAVAEACAEMLADGFRIAAVVDEYPMKAPEVVVKITTSEVNDLLGAEYSKDLIATTLTNVGFGVTIKSERGSKASTESGAEVLEISAPEWRTDIHIKEDIIEEVGRLLGYDNIKPVLPLHGTASRNEMFEFKHEIRDLTSRWGANEVLTYSFVSGRLLAKAGQDTDNSYRIVNSISPELQYVRQSIVPSLLEKAYMNQKLPVDKFAIFEMNKVYRKEWGMNEENVPVEGTRIGCVLAERKNTETAYYKAKKYASELLKSLNVEAEFVPLSHAEIAEAKMFEPKRSAEVLVKGEYVGVVGEFKNSVRSEFKLLPYLAGFELDLDKLLRLRGNEKKIDLREKEKRDLTIETNDTYAELVEKIESVLKDVGAAAEIMPIGIYQPDGSKKKKVSVHLEFAQMTDDVMEKLEKL